MDGMPLSLRSKISAALRTDEAGVSALSSAIVRLVLEAVYRDLKAPEIIELFPEDFNADLKSLVAVIIGAHQAEWQELVRSTTISLPKLIDTHWRVDIKSAASDAHRMHVPTCIVEMTIQEEAHTAGVMMGTRRVNFELNRATLETVLDGLGKIRDQLQSIKNL